jgi:hypothetical protein
MDGAPGHPPMYISPVPNSEGPGGPSVWCRKNIEIGATRPPAVGPVARYSLAEVLWSPTHFTKDVKWMGHPARMGHPATAVPLMIEIRTVEKTLM